ncbi:MAG: hypothetical protein Q8P30_02145 [Candidatus Uhrbacteria bacterium]|nr:hypothetical protein [Candidatus Uhrbacteria bacterium]
MPQVVPAILVKSKVKFEDKITNQALRKLAPLWQVDVLDKTMFKSSSWANAKEVSTIGNLPSIELHLMIQNPLPTVMEWYNKVETLKRAIIHTEIERPVGSVLHRIKKLGIETGLAINPETAVSAIEPYVKNIDVLLIMGVNPGKSAQKFLGNLILSKIRESKRRFPKLKVAVDGGVSLETVADIVKAGADQLCVASTLWKAKNIETVFHRLEGKDQ